MTNPAGVHNALRMREMFIAEGYNCRVDIEEIDGIVAIATVTHNLYFAAYYFHADGTYFRGAN